MDSLAESPSILVGGTRYFAVSVRSPSGPRGGSLVVLYPETSWRQARREAAMPALLLGRRLAGSDGRGDKLDRPPHERADPPRASSRSPRIAAGDFRELEPGGRRDEVADLTAVDQPDVLSTQRDAADDPAIGARQAAGPARRRAGSSASQLAHRSAHERPVARQTPSAPAGDETLAVALRQLALTEEQVKGLLSAGRVERSLPEICDVHQLLADVAALVDPACQHARVALGPVAPRRGRGSLELFADRSSLRAAILNLALNAIEAAGPGGTVSLEAYSRTIEVSIEVVDSGPGPPPELADVLYEPFVTSKPEGVGLGLALARQVALDHGGRLSWDRAGGDDPFRPDPSPGQRDNRRGTHEPHLDRR